MVRLSHYSQVDPALGLGSEEEPYVCVRCVEMQHPPFPSFKSRAHLTVHYSQEHLGLTKIVCPKCKESYSEKGW